MAQTLSNFDAALKIDYLPVIREQLNNASILLNKVQRNERDVSGKRWQLVAHYQRNSGVGSGAETNLPTAGNQAFVNPYDTVAYTRARIQVSGPVMAASRDDKGAIVRALDAEIQGAVRDLKKEVNGQLHREGTSRRCLVNGDPGTGTTLTVDNPGTDYLYDGMIIAVIADDTGVATDTTATISSVDSATEVTVSAALDTNIADNDWVVRYDSHDGAGVAASDSYEMMGIRGIVDDNTYVDTLHNLSRTTYAWWKCSTHSDDDNSGTNRDLTLDLMQASITAVENNGDMVNLIVCSPEIRDAYAALLVADKRFVNTLELDGGFKALEYSGIPVVADPDCYPNTMFFLNTDRLFIMQMGDWDWMDYDNGSFKIVLYAGTSDEYDCANYAKIRHCGQSAGKANVLARGSDGQRRLILNNKKKRKEKAVFLSRHLNSQHESDSYRQMCDHNLTDLRLPYRDQKSWEVATDKIVENQSAWLQEMFQVSACDHSLFSGEKRPGRVSFEICSNEGRKQHCPKRTDEETTCDIAKSPETICTTVQDTEDIVRPLWRHREASRNDLPATWL